MSTLSYLAGAAAEANINEAIRLEEERAHGEQLRAMRRRHEATLSEYRAHIDKYRNAVDLTLERHKERYDKLMQHAQDLLKYSQELAEKLKAYEKTHQADGKLIKQLADGSKGLYDEVCVLEATAFVRDTEVKNLISTVIPGVVDGLFRHMGKTPDAAAREQVLALLNHVMPTSTDPAFRKAFGGRIREEIAKADNRKERYKLNQAQMENLCDIAQELVDARRPPNR